MTVILNESKIEKEISKLKGVILMGEMSPKVLSAVTNKDFTITITFVTGEVKLFDVKPYLKYQIFEPLKDFNEFEKIYYDFGTLCWDCGAELSRDTFYMDGQST